jgi:3-phenylpropionate/trans-cinnamate dioxygenase ferredoxin component
VTSIRAASTITVPEGRMKLVNVGGREVLIVHVDGAYYALNNRCPHMGGSLAEGTLEGDIVTCPRHGSQYNVKTGEAVGKAKIAFIRVMPHNAETYETRVEGTNVIVELP